LPAIGFSISDLPSVCAQDEFTLEEITVTAQKREENQQDVPIAMDVASGDMMREMGYSGIDEVIQSMSSVFINEGGDGLRVSIRGMSSDEKAQGEMKSYSNASPVVAVNTDGVFTFGRKTGANMYDIERVEVLYGPQSTLYSSNSPGGIVNIVTAKPNTEKFEVSGRIDFGNYHNVETEGIVNVPLSDSTALRAAFITSSHEGYMANGSMDSNSKSVRGKILKKAVNDLLTIILTGQYLLDQTKGIGGGIDMFVNQDDVDDPWNNSYERSAAPRERIRQDFYAQVEWDLNIGLLTILGSTSKIIETAIMLGTDIFTLKDYDLGIDNWQREQAAEARPASPADSNIEWILGATYFKFRQAGINETVGTPFWMGTNNESKAHAFYGNITYPILDKFRVSGGLRYSQGGRP
jgi:iron complex outermembrane receptor protein